MSGSLHDTIAARQDAWAAAYNDGRIEDVVAFYDEDAAFLPPEAPRFDGREAIARALAGFSTVLADVRITVEQVRPLGDDHAMDLGVVDYVLKQPDGSRAPVRQKYQVVWRRGADGTWRYLSDMFNALPT
jgi:uncharacterized protein (TIGR02246 family)